MSISKQPSMYSENVLILNSPSLLIKWVYEVISMIKEFSLNNKNAILNFSVKYCNSPEELLNSKGFSKVLKRYLHKLEKNNASLLDRLMNSCMNDSIEETFISLFKQLLVLDLNDIKVMNNTYNSLLSSQTDLIDFIEGIYNYWRSLERYALIESSQYYEGIQNTNFISASEKFSNLVRLVYRQLEEKALGYKNNVYRQLNAGINAGLVLSSAHATLPEEYDKLRKIKFIEKVVLNPPFIIYPKENKRSGYFDEVDHNLLEDSKINKAHYFCYPAKVGTSLAFVYFHREYMNQGISLCNLFELAKPSEYLDKNPDLVYVFGGRLKHKNKKNSYYIDKKNDIYFGFANNTDEIDYFGYMKKMILTLHNLKMLDQGNLPIHGAMVNVTLKNGVTKNIAIVGDSGAGKSESLEAFRKLSEKYLKEIKIIFDDMGSFHIENNEVIGYGTETGAFVRLDDLEVGYAYGQMDRAIFMNPQAINSRLLIPVSTYKTITKGYKIDLLLYANNYDNDDIVLDFFDIVEDAIKVFTEGARKAKGTTSETGLVKSFFANPFGPYQRQEQTNEIINTVFSLLNKNKVPIGTIYTKLAVDGYEQQGPKEAATELFKLLIKK